eukprot:14091734-Alexandrium_andersonii.AAC.1
MCIRDRVVAVRGPARPLQRDPPAQDPLHGHPEASGSAMTQELGSAGSPWPGAGAGRLPWARRTTTP